MSVPCHRPAYTSTDIGGPSETRCLADGLEALLELAGLAVMTESARDRIAGMVTAVNMNHYQYHPGWSKYVTSALLSTDYCRR